MRCLEFSLLLHLLMLLMLLSCLAGSGLSSSLVPAEGVRKSERVKRSDDDISMGALLTLVQQQSSTIDRLQHDLAAHKTEMDSRMMEMRHKVDAASKSVAFTARISNCHDTSEQGLALSHHQTVVFDDVVTNVGGAYDHHTGVFTAPASGTYGFSLQQMPTNTQRRVYLAIVKNGVTLHLVFAEGSVDSHAQGSSQVTTHLRVGDRVWVRQHHGNRVRASWWTVFTGFLLHAD